MYTCRQQDRLIAEKCAPTDHIEVLLDTYAHQFSAQAHRLEIVSKQIEATEDLLNLRLESVQKNTFVANALFHMILTFLGIPTVMPNPTPHSQADCIHLTCSLICVRRIPLLPTPVLDLPSWPDFA